MTTTGSVTATGRPGTGVVSGEGDAVGGEPPPPDVRLPLAVHTELLGDALSASVARTYLRAALTDWASRGVPGFVDLDTSLTDDAVLLVSELVTNAVVHAGTAVELAFRLDPGSAGGEPMALVVEVGDLNASRVVQTGPATGAAHGLRLVSVISESWGVTYQKCRKVVWFRLPLLGVDRVGRVGQCDPRDVVPAELVERGPVAGPLVRGARGADPEWLARGALGFLAEASDLLAGQTDEDKVVSLAAQLVVDRLGDWCAVWREGDAGGPPRLVRVWHSNEERIEELRASLRQSPPTFGLPTRGAAVPWPWPGSAAAYGPGGAAVACRLVAGDRPVGTLLIGRAGLLHIPDEIMALIEDLSRRVALAIVAARRYTRQATISRVLQRGLLPNGVASIPGVETAVVYEPAGEDAWAGGDFYDVFAAGDGRWCFALGDVCGSGPEAAVVTGVARPVLRALAREGHTVASALDRLNHEVGEQPRFLSLLYGELTLTDRATVRCTLASAGHPLPLVLDGAGTVREAARPQLLLGVLDDATYQSETFELAPGDTLLCVTDGVTERRSGKRQLDDRDGLATLFAQCRGMSAGAIAERVRQEVHAFDVTPPADDLALLVMQPTLER